MTWGIVFVVGSLCFCAPPSEPWPTPGEVSAFDGDELIRYFDDVATADFKVSAVFDDDGKNKLDIGIKDHSFTLEELRRFFKFQRHKDFIVITYHKNAPVGGLPESLKELKQFFKEAGYKRILLVHGRSSGVGIHEDFRPGEQKE